MGFTDFFSSHELGCTDKNRFAMRVQQVNNEQNFYARIIKQVYLDLMALQLRNVLLIKKAWRLKS